MSFDVTIVPFYMEHEGGTKFYETVTISLNGDKHIVVTRWGKLNAQGEIKVVDAKSNRKADEGAYLIQEEKKRRGYRPTPSIHGLHGWTVSSWSESSLLNQLYAHYGHVNGSRVFIALGLEPLSSGVTGVWMDEASDIVIEEPTPEPDRDPTWGSW